MDPRLHTVVGLIRCRPRTHLQELAAAVGLSSSRLQHLFRDQLGVSIRSFSQAHFLSHAAALLVETHMSVKEIHVAFGFEDASSFCRAFKRLSGASPKAFRRESRSLRKLPNEDALGEPETRHPPQP
jgi:AraC family transcriptional regulator of arabinose operon